MEQSTNKINITGVLVKKGLEIRNVGEDNECISGSLVLRTDDGSEHEVNYYANKYKKDENGNITNEISKMYTGYETIIAEYTSLEDDKENADVIKIGMGEYSANDFKSPKDGSVVSTNKIRAKFANRLTDQEKEVTPKVATFELSGIVTKMQPEMIKDQPTGNGLVMLDVIGYGGTIIPVKLTIPSDLVTPFGNAGFYETGVGKFTGNLVNTKTVETIVEKQAFGDDKVEEKTVTKKLNEVRGGSPLGTLDVLKITQEEYATAQSKRRLKLDEIKNGVNKSKEGFTQAPQTQANPFTSTNPFGQPTANPFAR